MSRQIDAFDVLALFEHTLGHFEEVAGRLQFDRPLQFEDRAA